MAVAHTLLVIIYHLLRNRTTYEDRGETFLRSETRKRLRNGSLVN